MNKLIYITLSILFGLSVSPASAASATPAPTGNANDPVKEKLDEQINELKEKIASRVSELNLVEKRGIIGTVTETKGNQLTITDVGGNTRYVDVDEITKFSQAGNQNANFGLSDITAGTRISALGIYNKQSKRLLARFVKTYSEPALYSGVITSIDAKNFQIAVMTPEQKEIKVDIETSTKLSSYTIADGLARYGFSKLAVGDRISLAAIQSRTDSNALVASRLVNFIGIPKDPRIAVAGANTIASPSAAVTTPSVTTTPSPTAARRNLSPIR